MAAGLIRQATRGRGATKHKPRTATTCSKRVDTLSNDFLANTKWVQVTTIEENPTAHDYRGSKASDIAIAAQNTVKLGLSLLATWGLALVVRIQLPRHLGPVAFGNYNFADSFAAAFFVFVGFGLETYVQKEVPVRPEHASDFFGGAVIVRTVLGAVLIAAMTTVLIVTHRPLHTLQLVLMFAACQYLIAFGNLLSSMLRASASVGVLAGINVASKLVWAIGIAVGILWRVPLVWLAAPAGVAEVLRNVVLWRAARHAVGLRWRVDRAETYRVIRASLPYFANAIALTLVSKLDITLLEFVSPGVEVGWYSAASNLAALAMFLTPVLGWILMPLLARAKHRSREEFYSILRRALEACLVITVPVTLLIALSSQLLVRVAFGVSFLPAARSLQILAPMLVATYACILLTTGLILLDRPWLVTVISLTSIVVQPALMLSATQFL